MRFSIDSWDPAYGTSLQEASEELADAQVRMDLTVEVEPDAWRPVAPDGSTPPDVILFVDGVRRTEAHVWTHSDDPFQAAPGMCASYAAGVVRSSGGNAEVVSAEVRRGLFTVDPAAESISTSAGVWQVNHSAPGANPPGQLFVQALQRKLTELEVVCAASARSHLPAEDDLLLIDGPLRNRTELPRTLAFIKTQQAKTYHPNSTGSLANLHPESGRRCFCSAPSGIATPGTCVCRAAAGHHGRASFESSAPPHWTPLMRWPSPTYLRRPCQGTHPKPSARCAHHRTSIRSRDWNVISGTDWETLGCCAEYCRPQQAVPLDPTKSRRVESAHCPHGRAVPHQLGSPQKVQAQD